MRATQLVVLSACETGLGEVANGEGVYGLRRAFTLAGAQSQLMTLWRVSDDGTKDVMIRYYQGLTQGEGRGDALRQVQLDMIQEKMKAQDEASNYQHPYFWAAFIPLGNWSPLPKN
jgi:CHAT domain-containing protein